MYLRCPYCGSTNLDSERVYGYKAAFWGALFFHFWGVLLGWFFTRKTEYTCENCGFIFLTD